MKFWQRWSDAQSPFELQFVRHTPDWQDVPFGQFPHWACCVFTQPLLPWFVRRQRLADGQLESLEHVCAHCPSSCTVPDEHWHPPCGQGSTAPVSESIWT
jgi:hypothetical protein